jgi:hypothetical protein
MYFFWIVDRIVHFLCFEFSMEKSVNSGNYEEKNWLIWTEYLFISYFSCVSFEIFSHKSGLYMKKSVLRVRLATNYTFTQQ